jgi:NAD(P)-dependent dehydrogenase (short-subunit alcohol dehydrogenase family)
MAIVARVAIVTGGNRGIGLSIAAHLSARGWAVVLVARDEARLRAAHDQLSSDGGHVATVACNLAAPASTAAVLDAARQLGADIDVLVNAAGIFGPVGYMSQTDPAEWATVMDVNFMAALRLSVAVFPAMLRRGRGRIINVASAQILHPPDPVVSAYATSKVALAAASRALAAEVTARQAGDVSVCVLHPGDVRSDMWSDLSARAGAAGPEAAPLREWAAFVGRTGGDPPSLAAAEVLRICDRPAHETNGRFLLVPGIVRHPAATW